MKLPFLLARRFVAAETLDGALPKVRELNATGLHVSLDLLGEYVDRKDRAVEGRDAYIELIRRVGVEQRERSFDGNVSIKLSKMGQKIDREFCLESLRMLLDEAKANKVFVRLDMEGSDITESTLSLFETVYPDYPENVGIVLQAYLKRTGRDIDRMCELGARVRLCKGAYSEPASIAYQDMPTIREKFVGFMQTLLERGNYPAIATHDDQLIAATRDFATQNGIARDRFEFQMLYGIRTDTQRAIAAEGYNMRVYVPYGTEWFPYFSRRLRERKENVWFVLRNLVRA
jgi:proline dehydrogenase